MIINTGLKMHEKVKKGFSKCITVNLIAMGLEPNALNLSKVTGITKDTCRRYLRGESIPKKQYMLKVFDGLNYPIEGFIAMLHLNLSVKEFFILLNSGAKPNLPER
ncbi:helix-turn-helix transcriptional regulator [Halobacillus sp. A1]|uniref:helix-turn-helix domain-containing protein n=1 Tax=Halobacillus sp. A1 TaxID=2880262 RepID=UPI0020A6579E|nr:helix-turn-helix transcriptional regulator [Halobacillus sp. A1]MCP3032653.1 helix-turn-helix transcriptional regulator [Halobacillus sp. A1]